MTPWQFKQLDLRSCGAVCVGDITPLTGSVDEDGDAGSGARSGARVATVAVDSVRFAGLLVVAAARAVAAEVAAAVTGEDASNSVNSDGLLALFFLLLLLSEGDPVLAEGDPALVDDLLAGLFLVIASM